jgi:hypothetical protein
VTAASNTNLPAEVRRMMVMLDKNLDKYFGESEARTERGACAWISHGFATFTQTPITG